ncbi:Uncharacterised protein [Mycobacteroides abscessus]|nr:Uncharacterised protein [Mycobacteroides abscessus]
MVATQAQLGPGVTAVADESEQADRGNRDHHEIGPRRCEVGDQVRGNKYRDHDSDIDISAHISQSMQGRNGRRGLSRHRSRVPAVLLAQLRV